MFKTRQKWFCVAGAILATFSEDRCIFRGRRSTLDTSDLILRGRRSTSDVSWVHVFCESHCQRYASGDKVQIPWRASRFVTGDENRRRPRTKRRF